MKDIIIDTLNEYIGNGETSSKLMEYGADDEFLAELQRVFNEDFLNSASDDDYDALIEKYARELLELN
jgi:hypothetical protein